MVDRKIREAIALYAHGAASEAEAAAMADLPRAQFRHYVRTCGVVASPSPKSPEARPPQHR